MTNQRAPRQVKNPSGYHSSGSTHKEKVFNFARWIKEYDWTTEWKQEEDVLQSTSKRGTSEIISIWWPDNQWWPDVVYTYGGVDTKCRNISAAAKLASEKPDPEKMRRKAVARASTNRGIAGAFAAGDSNTGENLIESLRTTLPFDKESTPDEVKSILKKKVNPVIVWINRLSGTAEQDYIKTWSRHLKTTTNKEGKVIIHFVGANCFHSVYLESVIGLS